MDELFIADSLQALDTLSRDRRLLDKSNEKLAQIDIQILQINRDLLPMGLMVVMNTSGYGGWLYGIAPII